jgi:hypothetical protein
MGVTIVIRLDGAHYSNDVVDGFFTFPTILLITAGDITLISAGQPQQPQ